MDAKGRKCFPTQWDENFLMKFSSMLQEAVEPLWMRLEISTLLYEIANMQNGICSRWLSYLLRHQIEPQIFSRIFFAEACIMYVIDKTRLLLPYGILRSATCGCTNVTSGKR